MYICENLKIDIFIVGDENNLFIYGEEHIQNHLWRFGIEKIFQKGYET